jgi:TonB family protein
MTTRSGGWRLVAWVSFGIIGAGVACAFGQKVNKEKLESAVMHLSQARTFEGHGQVGEAVDEYRAALEEDPDEPYWYEALGEALEREGNSQEALEAYGSAIQLSPYDSGLTSRLQDLQRRIAAGTGENPPHARPPFKPDPHASPPRAVYAPDPPYSEKARLMKYDGVIPLLISIDAKGNVGEVTDLKPLGLGLDESAITVVRTWRFEPAMRDGTPVATQVNVEVSFHFM